MTELAATAQAPRATGHALDPRIFSATPNFAIELGFDQYLCDSDTAQPAIREGAKHAVAEFNAFAETFPLGSRERMHLTTLRMAAASIASGIARRKKLLAQRLQNAEDDQDLFLRGLSRGSRLGGFMAGAWKILLIGGFAFYLVHSLAPSVVPMPAGLAMDGAAPAAAANPHRFDPQYMSLATACGMTLLISTIKEFWSGFRLGRSRKKYKEEIKKANEWYQTEVSTEYKLAAETANIGWLQLTGNPPPMTRAFECLLAGVLTTCAEEPQTPNS